MTTDLPLKSMSEFEEKHCIICMRVLNGRYIKKKAVLVPTLVQFIGAKHDITLDLLTTPQYRAELNVCEHCHFKLPETKRDLPHFWAQQDEDEYMDEWYMIFEDNPQQLQNLVNYLTSTAGIMEVEDFFLEYNNEYNSE